MDANISNAPACRWRGIKSDNGLFQLILPELFPHFVAIVPTSALGALAATAAVGRDVLERTSPAVWRENLEKEVGIRITAEHASDAYVLRAELGFWISMVRKLGMLVPAGQIWTMTNISELVASRGMAEDVIMLLDELDRDDVVPWRKRMTWWPQCSVHRLSLGFNNEDLVSMRASYATHNGPTAWTSQRETMNIRGVPVPCILHVMAGNRPGSAVGWSIKFEVLVSLSAFPIYSHGIQSAIVVYFCSTAPCWHVQRACCLSYKGCDGHVDILPTTNSELGNETSHWLDHVLACGELHALAVVDCIDHMM